MQMSVTDNLEKHNLAVVPRSAVRLEVSDGRFHGRNIRVPGAGEQCVSSCNGHFVFL